MLKVFSTLNRVLEQLLDLGNALADPDAPPELVLEIRRGAQMIGMGMRLEDPGDLELALAHEGDDLIGEAGPGAPRRLIEVQRSVDDGGVPSRGLCHHVGDRVGLLMKERVDLRVHGCPPPLGPPARARLALQDMFALTELPQAIRDPQVPGATTMPAAPALHDVTPGTLKA